MRYCYFQSDFTVWQTSWLSHGSFCSTFFPTFLSTNFALSREHFRRKCTWPLFPTEWPSHQVFLLSRRPAETSTDHCVYDTSTTVSASERELLVAGKNVSVSVHWFEYTYWLKMQQTTWQTHMIYMHTSLLIPYFSFPWTFPSPRFYVLINYQKWKSDSVSTLVERAPDYGK